MLQYIQTKQTNRKMMLLDMIMEFLTGTTPYHVELRTFGIAFQGAMAVRNGLNKDKKMNPFHAFAWTTILGFGGGWFTFLFLGKPTSMIASGDVNITLSFLAFLIVNYMPGDIGYKLGMSLPGMLLTTSLAQMFRSMGTIGFISTAAKEISPSKYYGIPVLGPILYGSLLGNMGAFFVKGFDGHLKNGMPWPFQNGLFIGTFFHLFAHDVSGSLGTGLRSIVYSIVDPAWLSLDDRTFALFVMNLFMLVTGIMRMPQFYGPAFNPILAPYNMVMELLGSGNAPTKKKGKKKKSA